MGSRTKSANGKNGSKWIRGDKRLAIYLRDGFVCAYCGRDLHGAPAAEVTLDHLDAKHAAGHHAATNLMTACRSCNSSRQDQPWRQYATGGAVERIVRLRRRALPAYLQLARAVISGAVPRAVAVVEARRA